MTATSKRFTILSQRQRGAVMSFLNTARSNGLRNLWAALPTSDDLVRTNVVSQIRRATDALALGYDELGNRVRLTPDLRIIQDLPGDPAK